MITIGGGLITIGGDWLHCNLHPRLPPKTTSMIRSHDNIHNHLPIAHDNIHDPLLDEVHLWPNCSLFDDDISCNTDVNNKRIKFPMILVFFLLNTRILIYNRDLAEKLRTEALWQLRRRKRGRHLWRKAPRQPKPDNCSWSHPHAASPRAHRESVLRRRIYPDTCAQNTWESGRVKNQVLFLQITQWSCFLCLAAVSCTPCTPRLVSLFPWKKIHWVDPDWKVAAKTLRANLYWRREESRDCMRLVAWPRNMA